MNSFNQKQLDLFFHTAEERHRIYKRKKEGIPKEEWTKDRIFREWRFCNVYRKLDKVTEYIIKNVIESNEQVEYDSLYRGVIISRFFSKIETLEFIKKNYDLFDSTTYPEMVKGLLLLQKKQSVITNAFMSTGRGLINGKTFPKLLTPFLIITQLENLKFFKIVWREDRANKSIEEITKYLSTLFLVGSFMAYEYATDLTYSKLYYPDKPDDYYTYCPIHQGSLRGLNRLIGKKPTKEPISNFKDLTLELLSLWNAHIKETQVLELDENGSLSMREVEHWLCEFDKYMRVYNGETNRLKRRYKTCTM